ncbi:MAG: type II toxin-antitoxin system HicB family antitoxin [Bacteroidales bacterium]|jgi:predicted RNase H-like HicB family nuclease|nr:type II toxin-antitoxin system HicB family antitoxin [Bacteroidales bacterium]
MNRSFTLEYWIDDDFYVGKIKEVPGVFSQGETLSELEENIKDAYHLMLEEETIPFDLSKVNRKDLVIQV